MTDRQDGTDKVTVTVNLGFGALGLRPAPGIRANRPIVSASAHIGPFAELLALEDIPAWSGQGLFPPGVLGCLEGLQGPPQFLLAITETEKETTP